MHGQEEEELELADIDEDEIDSYIVKSEYLEEQASKTKREEMKDHKMYRANIDGKVVQDQRKRSIILKSSIATTYFFQFSFNLIDYMSIQSIYFITPDRIIEQVFLEKVMTTR